MKKRLIVLEDGKAWTEGKGYVIEVNKQAYSMILDGYSPMCDAVEAAGMKIINEIPDTKVEN